jgi:hypothetical protein
MLLNKKQYMLTECFLLLGQQWEGRFGGVHKLYALFVARLFYMKGICSARQHSSVNSRKTTFIYSRNY